MPSKPSKELRFAIYARDKYRCFYCKLAVSLETATLDHLVPKALGGRHRASNLVTACLPCNQARAALPLNQRTTKRERHRLKRLMWRMHKRGLYAA